jgi:hypothetical protein
MMMLKFSLIPILIKGSQVLFSQQFFTLKPAIGLMQTRRREVCPNPIGMGAVILIRQIYGRTTMNGRSHVPDGHTNPQLVSK